MFDYVGVYLLQLVFGHGLTCAVLTRGRNHQNVEVYVRHMQYQANDLTYDTTFTKLLQRKSCCIMKVKYNCVSRDVSIVCSKK
jgi:hypothetical protein